MVILKAPRGRANRFLLSLSSFSTTTWYSSPSTPHHGGLTLLSISEAINNSHTKPLESSLKSLLPSLTVRHLIDLINFNPYCLSPLSLLSFFNWLSSQPTFRHTLHSYCAMAQNLCNNRMGPEAQSLLRYVVSRKGKDSAFSIFAAIVETRGIYQSNVVFDSLMKVYTDCGFVSDAIQCFRLVVKNNFGIPFHGCEYLLGKMMKLNLLEKNSFCSGRLAQVHNNKLLCK